ncbi:MAG: hypothetical protein OES79_14715, partial [Planctomycetota bacterium]|nr:hypothetical protein [Planctomycetota bacterium]
APHHGSPNSDPQQVAAWCQPEWTIVSSGFVAIDPSVVQTYSRPGRRLLQTAVCGATCVAVQNGRLDVSWMRQNVSPPQPTVLAETQWLDSEPEIRRGLDYLGE